MDFDDIAIFEQNSGENLISNFLKIIHMDLKILTQLNNV